MSTLYDRSSATALRLLTQYGQTVTLTKAGAPAYDPATGTSTPSGGSVQTVAGAVFEYNTFIRSGQRTEKDSLIQAGDKQLLLAATATDGTALVAPKAVDTVTLASGVPFTITSVAPLQPSGQPVYYECNIRGAS